MASHHYSNHETSFTPLEGQLFSEAVETLQQLKTTFSPLEKLLVIRRTFEQMTRVTFLTGDKVSLLNHRLILFSTRLPSSVVLQ